MGYGTRVRAAQAFAFLAAAVELLVASWPELPLTDHEGWNVPASQLPLGLQVIMKAARFSQVRGVYVALQRSPDATVLFAVHQPGNALRDSVDDV